MKSVRKIFLLSSIISIIPLGFVVYQMFWGPEHIQVEGKNLTQLLENGDLLPLLIVPGVLIISALAILPFLRILFPSEIKGGMTAQARVLKVWDTGVSINDNPQVGLLLEYSIMGSSPLQVEDKTVVSRLNAALVQPGVTAEIKYDPKNPQRIQIISLNIESPAPAQDASIRLEELNELHDKKLITEEEYQQKREEILKSL